MKCRGWQRRGGGTACPFRCRGAVWLNGIDGGETIRQGIGNPSNSQQYQRYQYRDLSRDLEFVRVNGCRFIQLVMILRKLPKVVICPLLLATIVRIGNGESPCVDVGSSHAIGPKQVNVFTGELADVVMEERRTLCDEYQVVTGVPVNFH